MKLIPIIKEVTDGVVGGGRIAGLLLLFGLAVTFAGCFFFKYPRDGKYLIPSGYTGDVIILFDQPDGVVPDVEEGLYVYRIPAEGILKVKTPGYTGVVNSYYFYVDGNGGREQVPYLRVTGSSDINGNPKDRFDNQLSPAEYENGIYVMNTGGIATINTKSGLFSYTSFVIGRPKDCDRLYDAMQIRITNLQRSLKR